MDLRPYQRECIEAIPERGRFLIQMATGLGKCFARDTEVLMYDGTVKKVQEIRAGDSVMGWDSLPRTVVSLAHGVEPMYEVRQNKKKAYVVNESHILSLCITGISAHKKKYVMDNHFSRYTTGDIVNISVRDYLECTESFKHVAKGYSVSVDFTQDEPAPDYFDPYFLGLWLGDGNSRGLAITTPDLEVVEYIRDFARLHDYEVIEREFDRPNKAKLYALKNTRHDAYMREFIRSELYLNKHIPHRYKTAPRDVRFRLLAGLLDSDGYLHKQDGSTFEYCSKSERLVSDVAFVARSLGLSAREFARYNRKYERDYYYCCIWGPTALIPTRIKRKQAVNNSNKHNLLTGISVRPCGVGEYFGFTLAEPDRRFLLADFTVVHNTVTFANIPRRGRMLILSHRDELVRQPVRYFDVPVGIEQAGERSCCEEVISASVPSIVRRLSRFSPDMFDVVVVDEAHHAAARSYRKVLDYFKPRLVLGFTATPNRGDGVGLEDVFEDIIFERDLEWGIKHGYLSDVRCVRCDIGFDLRDVSCRLGDFSADELEAAVNITSANKAVAEAYRRYAQGQTLVFAASVAHAEAIAREIPGSEVVIGGKDRSLTLERFRAGDLKCIVNCMVFTEGTDLPNVESVMIVRPTKNVALYTQMVGRGMRLFPGKNCLTLIDCVGASALNLCTAPSLLGLDASLLDPADRLPDEVDIFDVPEALERVMDVPRYWIRNAELVDLWAKGRRYNLHGVNWFRTARGDLVLGRPRFRLAAPDKLGRVLWNGRKVSYQRALDEVYKALCANYEDLRVLWDVSRARRWGEYRATDRQVEMVRRFLPDFDTDGMTKAEAGAILTRFFIGRDLR